RLVPFTDTVRLGGGLSDLSVSGLEGRSALAVRACMWGRVARSGQRATWWCFAPHRKHSPRSLRPFGWDIRCAPRSIGSPRFWLGCLGVAGEEAAWGEAAWAAELSLVRFTCFWCWRYRLSRVWRCLASG